MMTMKLVLAVCVFVAVVYGKPQTYDSRYDDVDVQTLVESVRTLKAYALCFIGRGPCTPQGLDYKKIIPEAVRTNCIKCTPKQRELVRTVIKAFQAKTPELWKELVDKEDPKGEYKDTFSKFINSTD